MISIVDYGLGNVQAFATVYKNLGIDYSICSDPDSLLKGSHIILPGVGAFDWALSRLDKSGMRSTLDYLVLDKKVPVLGVCVGMQMMANSSDEGELPGLGWINGSVKQLVSPSSLSNLPLPHMGWNDISAIDHPLFDGLPDSRFYFLHSYMFVPYSIDNTIAHVDYGLSFAAAVGHEHVLGVQFHPEKSHNWGVRLLYNFSLL